VQLISTASSDAFPQNTIAEFTTLLSNALRLEGEGWQVCLHNISFHKNWVNLVSVAMVT
jgi:hypothetical protein